MYGVEPPLKWIESDPPERGLSGPKFRTVIASICAIEAADMLMPLFPVRLPPSIMPPEIEMRLAEVPSLIAALAVVEPLIWMAPFNKTHVLDCRVKELAPT